MSKIDPNALSDEQRKVLKALKDERDARFRKEQKYYRIAIVILLIGVILLSIRDGGIKKSEVLLPDYSVAVDEPNAYVSQDSQMNSSQSGNTVTLVYADKVTYSSNENRVSLHYSNPSDSTAAAILQIIVYDADGAECLLAQSGVLRPGYSVDALAGALDENSVLDSGSYSGVMRVLFYNTHAGSEPTVSTDISVTITVK